MNTSTITSATNQKPQDFVRLRPLPFNACFFREDAFFNNNRLFTAMLLVMDPCLDSEACLGNVAFFFSDGFLPKDPFRSKDPGDEPVRFNTTVEDFFKAGFLPPAFLPPVFFLAGVFFLLPGAVALPLDCLLGVSAKQMRSKWFDDKDNVQ